MRASLLPQADRLGREVGERIKAGVDEKLRDVRVGVNADTAKANAELDKTKVKADELGRKDEKINVSVNNSGSVMGWIVSAIAGAVAIAPAFAVAGVGVAAFAALAIPSLSAVAKYEHEVSTGSSKATAQWQKLTGTQKALAAGVTSLGAEFHHMSQEVDPQVLQVFESAVADIDRILPSVVPLAKSAAGAIVGLLDSVGAALTDSQAQQFFQFVAKNIGPDMAEIDQVIVALVHTFFNLVEALQPTSLALLHIVAGFADLLSWISKVAPGLDSVIVLSIALYRPLKLIQGIQLGAKFAWIPQAVTWMKDFTVATEGATVAEKAQLATSIALDAVDPWKLAAVGAVAIAALTYELTRNLPTMDAYIAKLREQDKATGFNIAGYQKLAAQTDNAGRSALALNTAERETAPAMTAVRVGAAAYSQAVGQVNTAHIQAASSAVNLNEHLSAIQRTFGLTRGQAEQLALAAGVTAKQLTGSGATAQEAMNKIIAYGKGQTAATQTSRALTLAVQGLTSSMEAQVVPLLTLEGDEVSWKQAQQAATTAINANHNALDGNSKSALAARAAIISATGSVVKFAEEQLKTKGNLQGASNSIQDQIRWLEKHAGKSKIATEEIHALRMEEAKIKAQIKEQIIIDASGSWSLSGAPGHLLPHHRKVTGAQGVYITQGTTATADDVLLRASKGELVVPTNIVDSGAVDHLRGQIPGFATGGVAGSYSGGVPGATNWLDKNYNATVDYLSSSIAAAAFAKMQAQFASMQAAVSSSALGGDSAANKALARRMFPWPASMWPSFDYLEMREAGYNRFARNPSSGAYGIPQALPPTKMPIAAQAAGGSHAGPQLSWMYGYIGSVYGNPVNAANHERAFSWYDDGGWMPPGYSLNFNGTGKPEPVFSDTQWRTLSGAVAGGDGASAEYHAHFDGASSAALQSEVRLAFRAMEMQSNRKHRVGRRR